MEKISDYFPKLVLHLNVSFNAWNLVFLVMGALAMSNLFILDLSDFPNHITRNPVWAEAEKCVMWKGIMSQAYAQGCGIQLVCGLNQSKAGNVFNMTADWSQLIADPGCPRS